MGAGLRVAHQFGDAVFKLLADVVLELFGLFVDLELLLDAADSAHALDGGHGLVELAREDRPAQREASVDDAHVDRAGVRRAVAELRPHAFREDSDSTLRVFPWQDAQGNALAAGAPKTKPRLRPAT